jgi:uncharacterized protein (TIGR00251 family)
MAGPQPLFSTDASGLVLAVKAQPKASRDAVVGVMATADGQALKVTVTAAPEDGKANAAVAAVIAKRFGVAKSAVSVVTGATGRRKLLHIAGDPAALSHIAQQWISP